MAADRIIELRDVSELRQVVSARPPGIVHGTAIVLTALIAAALTWASLTEANVVVRAAARVRPVDAPLRAFDEVTNEQLHAEVGGRIVEIAVSEGQVVTRGQVLVRLDTARIDNELARLEAEVTAGQAEAQALDELVVLVERQFEASRKRAEAELSRSATSVRHSWSRAASDQRLARVELEDAKRELANAQTLADSGAGPAGDVANARVRVARARERLAASGIGVDDGEPEVLRRTLDQAERDHQVKLVDLRRQRAVKQGEVVAARRRLANLSLERGHATLVAHRAGIVTLGGLALGDLLSPGKLPLAITEQGRLRVDAAVDTGHISDLRVGMAVRVKLDALDVQRYGTATGHITHISADALADPRRGATYYLVSVALDADAIGQGDLQGQLKAGMTGELEAITERASLLALFFHTIRGSISL